MSRIDKQTLRRFYKLVKLILTSEMRFYVLGLASLMVGFSLTLSYLNVRRSYVDRDFSNALFLRDESRFINELWMYLFIFVALVLFAVFYRFIEERLALLWRNWLSRHLLDKYLQGSTYYRISLDRSIDNPDQRLEEDIRSFTTSSLSFALIFFNSIVALIAFVSILWSISTVLVLGAVVYAAIGTLVTYFLGRPLIGLNFAQLKKEADYRYKLVNIRDYSESIAFYRGAEAERLTSKLRLADAIGNLKNIIRWNRNLGFFTHGYNNVLAVLPTILVAPLYLQGKIEFGQVVQAGGAFGQVLGALSIIVTHFSGISSLAAVTNRLGAFSEAIDQATRESKDEDQHIALQREQKAQSLLSCSLVTLFTPRAEQLIVKDLTIELKPGERLLITGASGLGKSSILRMCAGLWSRGSGKVSIVPDEEVFFIPQRPYMPLGTFRSQLTYGVQRQDVTEEEIKEVLQLTGLEATLERISPSQTIALELEEDWKSLLSLGEQELVAFARALLARPKLLFLDEAVNAIDEEKRKLLYEELLKRKISFVSVGSKAEFEKYHTHVLELFGKGKWKFSSVTSREAV